MGRQYINSFKNWGRLDENWGKTGLKMTDLGKLSWVLGIQFECKNNDFEMSQSRYIEKILSKFGMADCKPYSTPCEMDITKTSDKTDL